MPLFYNNAEPTPTGKNTINTVTVDYGIRDYLLNRNLPVYMGMNTSINGSPRIGEPVLDLSVNNDVNVVPNGLPLDVAAITNSNNLISQNQFRPTSPLYFADIRNQPRGVGMFGSTNIPTGIQYPSVSDQIIHDYGLFGKTNYAGMRDDLISTNRYIDRDSNIDSAEYNIYTPYQGEPQGNYLEMFNSSVAGDVLNVIGSIFNGQGIGLSNQGVVPNFDFRGSLIGRVLGTTGLIKDTKLGQIGAEQLMLALANNSAFNVQQGILGALDINGNVNSLLNGDGLSGIRPDYKITVGDGKVDDFISRVLGYTKPKSKLSTSPFQFVSDGGNIERANEMIKDTGGGQVSVLLSHADANLNGAFGSDNPDLSPFRSGYAPGYTNRSGNKSVNFNLYAFYDANSGTINNFMGVSTDPLEIIPEISYRRAELVKSFGFLSPEDTFTGPRGNAGYENRKASDVGFTWTSSNGGALNSPSEYDELPTDNKKTLLAKTQKLFNSKGMSTIVSVKGKMGESASQLQQTNGFGISRGSAVIRGDRFTSDFVFDGKADTAENTYCRSWTTLDRYDKVSKMVRSSGLSKVVPFRLNTDNSVLGDYGFVKMSPYVTDKMTDPNSGVAGDPKNYMFSIENLAWCDEWQNLPPYEIGDGDRISGKKGRIMWFPPYNISFNETSSVSLDSTAFIGRGEPVYTYNNTERSGNLSFSVIVDHSTYTNAFKGMTPDDNYVASFMAGCIDPDSKMSERLTVSETSVVSSQVTVTNQIVPVNVQTPPTDLMIYFPNDVDVIPTEYEDGLSGGTVTSTIDYDTNPTGSGYGLGTYQGSFTSNRRWEDENNFGLNYKGRHSTPTVVGNNTVYGILDPNTIPVLREYLKTKCTACVIEVAGFASIHGDVTINQKLADARADRIITKLKSELFAGSSLSKSDIDKRFKKMPSRELTNTGCVRANRRDELQCKKDRRAVVHFRFDPTLLPKTETNIVPQTKTVNKTVNTKITSRMYNESVYFEQLTDNDSFVFDTFREKIRYFHPAFHSTTPEGLNSRLTFLHQCTRQGSTFESADANNLAFGRPPVCILRLGDFYHTKIFIENLSIDYEPLVWDLNPEGVGVQPMIANVNISFKFIGGSSLGGAVNKLQNALSFNYYANTHVYDPRADYIAKDKSGKSEYVLVNGIRNVNDPKLGYFSTKTSTTNKEVVTNGQVVGSIQNANNLTDPNQITQSGTTYDDAATLSRIVLNGYYEPDTTDKKILLRFTVNQGGIYLDPSNAKSYDARVYLTKVGSFAKTNLGTVIIRYFNSTHFRITNTDDTDSRLVSNDIGGKYFYISIPLSDRDLRTLSSALTDSEDPRSTNVYVVELQWETGTKTVYNFNKRFILE